MTGTTADSKTLEQIAGLPEVLPKGAHECHCEICPEYCMGDCVCGGVCYCKEERKE